MKLHNPVFPLTGYKSDKSLEFNGTDDWMACISGLVDTFPIHRSDAVTVSVWVKSTKNDASEEQVIMSRWFPIPTLAINEGGWRIYLWDVPSGADPAVSRACVMQLSTHLLEGLWLYSQSSFPLNTWVHVCLTYDGSGTIAGLKMYWDGVQQSTYTIYSTWTTEAINSSEYTHLLWGCQYTAWYPGGSNPDWPPVLHYWFEGGMDETAVYSYELDSTEVGHLYHEGKPQSPLHVGLPNGRPCETHWRMGEFSDGTTIAVIKVCYARYPVGGVDRGAWWNNIAPSRVSEDVPA